MNNLFSFAFIFIAIVAIIVSLFSAGISHSYEDFGINPKDISISLNGFTWPLPNRFYISSHYGYRNLNLYGSGPFHSGIDIPAPEGTYFLATMSGTVVYTGFSGSGGYTIILEQDDLRMTYCHTSPNFLVKPRRFCRAVSSYWASWSSLCL